MTLIYQSAIGIHLTINTSYDLTGYTTLQLIITKPSGVKLTKTPTVSNVTTGVLTYETISGDLDEVGLYRVQIIVTYPGGDVLKGELDKFAVYTPL